MATGSPMAVKTAKARKMDMLEMREIQSHGDIADYIRGRYPRDWRKLTPMEQWAVRRGYCEDPFKDRPRKSAGDKKYIVYFADGKRQVYVSLERATARFMTDDNAVKMWDGLKFIKTVKRSDNNEVYGW